MRRRPTTPWLFIHQQHSSTFSHSLFHIFINYDVQQSCLNRASLSGDPVPCHLHHRPPCLEIIMDRLEEIMESSTRPVVLVIF